MQQALGYAELLQVPFAFSSNGDRLLFHNKINTDGILEKEIEFDEMPSPEMLIIGRGTRINEDFDKFFFTIMDFKKATELFADPDFDGDPVQIYEPQGDESPVPPDNLEAETEGLKYPEGDESSRSDRLAEKQDWGDWGQSDEFKVKRYVVADVEVKVASERVQYYDADGKLVTESLKDYTRKAVNQE
ncbi:hypothetical protein [Lyngbya sp. CCY1209]|uniref:hypothetical protein n=1 Tax=Lyngbya sp. CCY1209 TaxID=2886103 RepID=UPI002D21703B|nr:hypothetical protein [Lyngbya sp. CCY1209]MEB3882053.1 hypothetical protein [Lyngbya sp. CCY1209]